MGKEPSLAQIQADKYKAIQEQAKQYMNVVYGPSIWYQAPEAEPNILIRWIRCLAEGNMDAADEYMTLIGQMAAEQQIAAEQKIAAELRKPKGG